MNTLSTAPTPELPPDIPSVSSGAVAQSSSLFPAQPRRRSRSLAHDLVEGFAARIKSGEMKTGDKLPTESELVRGFGVSRTVVREAISRMQAAGLVDTQHGVGTFVLPPKVESSFYIASADIATAMDVLAVLELRISLETEAAGLAASRRSAGDIAEMRKVLDDFARAVQTSGDTVTPDIQFHLQIARATGNRYFVEVMSQLGNALLPRARINAASLTQPEQDAYLLRVNQEHEQIFDAVSRGDVEGARAAMRLHLGNGRERQRRALEAVQRATDSAV
jgi:GntR family transcriptional repressor for pyruvate dehydrogenase complex